MNSPLPPWDQKTDQYGYDETPFEYTAEQDIPAYGYEYGYDLPEAPPVAEPVRKTRSILKWIKRMIVLLVVMALLLVAGIFGLRWYTPEESAFMLAHDGPVIYEWVDLNNISRHIVSAAIVAEDTEFISRTAPFDFEKFIERVKDDFAGELNEGGSTIPQQLTKNMFLYEGESKIRKAIEAVLSTPVATTIGKPRQMELYLNYAQTGPDLFGICTGSWYYFNSAPWNLSPTQAAELVSIFPLPSEARRVDTPEGGIYVIGPKSTADFHAKLDRIPNDIRFLGGYKAMMEKIGIMDDASDHAAERDTTKSCSTMPAEVNQLLIDGGYVY
jgi:monofunctional biosynthetic peptidoglycan transglycosylase